jgi:hypothetical protein
MVSSRTASRGDSGAILHGASSTPDRSAHAPAGESAAGACSPTGVAATATGLAIVRLDQRQQRRPRHTWSISARNPSRRVCLRLPAYSASEKVGCGGNRRER